MLIRNLVNLVGRVLLTCTTSLQGELVENELLCQNEECFTPSH